MIKNLMELLDQNMFSSFRLYDMLPESFMLSVDGVVVKKAAPRNTFPIVRQQQKMSLKKRKDKSYNERSIIKRSFKPAFHSPGCCGG